MQTSYRARILANPRFFVHRLSQLAVSIPLFPIHVSNCYPISLTLAPLTSSLSRFLASSLEFAILPPVLTPPPLFITPIASCLCIRTCMRVLGVSDERTRYTRCLPFTILTRRTTLTTRSHLFPTIPLRFLFLSPSVPFFSCNPRALLGHPLPICDPILSVMLSLF